MACASTIFKDTHFRSILECQLCLDDIKDPKALPCLHTFCMTCLDTLAGSTFLKTRVTCPLCCRIWEIPRQGAAALPTNFLINTLMDIAKAPNDENIGRTRKDECGAENSFTCEQHSSPLELFCRDDKTLICYACYAHDHPGHTFILVEQAAALCSEEVYFGMRQHLRALHDMQDNVRRARRERIAYGGDTSDDLVMSKAIVESTMTQLETLGGNGHPVENIRFCLRVRDQGLPVPRHQERLPLENWEVYCGDIMGSLHPYDLVSSAVEVNVDRETLEQTQQRQDDDLRKWIQDILQTGANRVTSAFGKLFKSHAHVKKSYLPGRGFISDLTLVGPRGLVAVRPGRLEFYRSRNLIKSVTGDFRYVASTADLSIAATNNSNKIKMYSPSGVYLRDIEVDNLSKTCGIARSSNGHLILDSGSETMAETDLQTGHLIRRNKITGFGNRRYISAEKDGPKTVVSDFTENTIKVEDGNGEVIMKCGDGINNVKLQSPRGVCFLENGDVVVADCWNHRVVVISSSGNLVSELISEADGLNYPHSVAVDCNGSLLIGDEKGQLFDVQVK